MLIALDMTFEGGFEPVEDRLGEYLTRLSGERRTTALRASGVQHSRLVGAAPCYAALAGRKLADKVGIEDTGIICTGGPVAADAAQQFMARANDAGMDFVNPLQFPGTLPSATATIVAKVLGAHAFAFVLGAKRLSFFQVLRRAAAAIQGGYARQVFCLSTSSSELSLPCFDKQAALVDVSIGLALSVKGNGRRKLIEVGTGTPPGGGGLAVYHFEWLQGRFSSSLPSLRFDWEALGASGAVLCIAALIHHDATAANANQPLCIHAVDKDEAFWVVFG